MSTTTKPKTHKGAEIITCQAGPQTEFFRSRADFLIFGGQAGGGKSWSILAQPAQSAMRVKGFRAAIFRRTLKEIEEPGALWDESNEMFPGLGGVPKPGRLSWVWPSMNTRIQMAHLQNPDSHTAWQGAQVPYIAFDEMTHFKELQFWYLTSRLRSMAGVRGRFRGTCNPDPDSFVAKLIDWWIDDDGFPMKGRSGLLRFFLRVSGTMEWADTAEELIEQYKDVVEDPKPKSLTFIPSSIHDNPILLKKDPDYLGFLEALPPVERARLLGGNWKVRASGGLFEEAEMHRWEMRGDIPKGTPFATCDAAYSSGERRDWTALVIGVVTESQDVYIVHSWRKRMEPRELVDQIFDEMIHWRSIIGLNTLHIEAHKMAFTTFDQEMRIRNFWFELYELKHAGRQKPARIRDIRTHLPRIHFRSPQEQWLVNDLVAYNPDGDMPDDGPDALAYFCEICEYNPNHVSDYVPEPKDPIDKEIWRQMHGYHDNDEVGMV